MRTKIPVIILFVITAILSACGQASTTSGKDPWTEKQLLDPAELAKTLNTPGSPQPYIFCIGPQAVIKGSIDIGSTVEKANLAEFGKQLDKLPKDADIVIYCGCCPFERCPNIRPAFELLNKKQFKNQKLLNLPRNVKVDWIDHGYPVEE
jgi:thiosulfate/3-mercaptopyruvate sulfurtransferase